MGMKPLLLFSLGCIFVDCDNFRLNSMGSRQGFRDFGQEQRQEVQPTSLRMRCPSWSIMIAMVVLLLQTAGILMVEVDGRART